MTARVPRILVVDDNPEDCEFIAELLAGFDTPPHVAFAATGEDALAHLGSEGADCILLDYRLEGEDGIDILPRVVEINRFCPVIMMTGQGSETVAAEAIKAGAYDYLMKAGITAESVRRTVRSAMEVAALERDLARKEDELMRAGRLDALGQLAGGIAHDFNNLLATVEYALTLGLRNVSAPKPRRHLGNALDTLRRGADLTRRLMAFAANQPGVATARRIGDVFDDFESLVRPTIGTTFSIQMFAEDPDALVHCDQSQLDHALVNLAINARDAIVESGSSRQIRVSATAPTCEGENGPVFVEFTVADDGPGMTREVMERATDPYFTTKERGSGTGLGLSMVYGFVQQADGEFRIESGPGEGTSVHLRLPACTAAAEPARPPAEEPAAAPDGDRGRRVLVVDDEVLLLLEAAEILREFGYEVIEATSATEALEVLDPDNPIDLLLTDVHMPGEMNGFELAKAICRRFGDVKVLYFSGYTGYSAAEMGEIVAPVVTKPCDPHELERHIRMAL